MNRHERRKARKLQKPDKPIQMCVEEVSARNSETGHDELYLVIDGQRVAYRGYSEESRAMAWIPLVDGFKIVEEHPDDGRPVYDAGVVQYMPEPKGSA